jgi:DNA repair exonuclease SbcCD ATPase subunit
MHAFRCTDNKVNNGHYNEQRIRISLAAYKSQLSKIGRTKKRLLQKELKAAIESLENELEQQDEAQKDQKKQESVRAYQVCHIDQCVGRVGLCSGSG